MVCPTEGTGTSCQWSVLELPQAQKGMAPLQDAWHALLC